MTCTGDGEIGCSLGFGRRPLSGAFGCWRDIVVGRVLTLGTQPSSTSKAKMVSAPAGERRCRREPVESSAPRKAAHRRGGRRRLTSSKRGDLEPMRVHEVSGSHIPRRFSPRTDVGSRADRRGVQTLPGASCSPLQFTAWGGEGCSMAPGGSVRVARRRAAGESKVVAARSRGIRTCQGDASTLPGASRSCELAVSSPHAGDVCWEPNKKSKATGRRRWQGRGRL